jgi:hypothetical protein
MRVKLRLHHFLGGQLSQGREAIAFDQSHLEFSTSMPTEPIAVWQITLWPIDLLPFVDWLITISHLPFCLLPSEQLS